MSAAPWSVKGIDPKAREVAKDLARRSGMTLGEWLNTMIMDDVDDEETVVPLSRRAHVSDVFERRGRSRRMDDVYGSDDTLQRVAASVEAIAARLEAAERRSTLAIQGVDQAVNGLVRRLDGQEAVGRTYGRRIDDIAEELREGHRRLRSFEQETGPKTAETFGKVESGLGALASRLYDIEERQRTSFNELRQRMEAAEKGAQPGPGADLMAQASARLDQAQAQTTAALRGLERSFAGLDQRLRAAEGRVEPEGAREAARFEKLAETLSRQVETNRSEMMRRLDTAEQDNRLARIEAAVAAAAEQVKAAEQRSALGIESMGREVLRIAENLNGRVQTADIQARATEGRIEAIDGRINRVEIAAIEKMASIGEALASDLNRSLGEKMDREMARHAQIIDHRLTRAEDQQALGLERLGAEITRISDRLSDRIAQSERKSAQALDDVARRLGDSSDRVEQAYGRVSGEMGERLRLSEERTAALIAHARETMDRRAERATESSASGGGDLRQPDWRSAAFPEETFDDDSLWASPSEQGGPAPFPAFESPAFETPAIDVSRLEPVFGAEDSVSTPRAVAEAAHVDRLIADEIEDRDVPSSSLAPSAFGGADVEDALAATPSQGPFAVQAPAASSAFDEPEALGDIPGGFAADDRFVDVAALRAGLSAGVPGGRPDSTRGAIDAARAAMAAPSDEDAPARGAFGLKRGGKSRLQERLDKQSQRDSSTVRKTLLASLTATLAVGGVYATGRLTDVDIFSVPTVERILGLGAPAGPSTADDAATSDTTLAAVALIPAVPSPEAQTLFDKAVVQIDAGDKAGLETLTQAANLGLPVAQLKLADLYQGGTGGAARNLTEARTWARRAAEAGDPRGMHAYGMYLFDAVGGPKNRPEALNWLLKAADRGLVDSQFNAAKIYETGDEGIAASPADALKWYLIAAKAGDQQARASADRLSAKVPAAGRQAARDAANAFAVEPAGA